MQPTMDMTVSPYDRRARTPQPMVKLHYQRKSRCVPSRFNARTVGADGRLILWNTYSGAIVVFAAKDRDRVLAHLGAAGCEEPLDKVADFLYRRGFLVQGGTDEVDRFRFHYGQEQWRTDVFQLILLATEDCNFRCVYCYEKFERGTMTADTRQAVRALMLRRAPTVKSLSISWFGGEPLYGWDAVEELAPFFHDVAEKHGMFHRQNMTTNGFLLTEERATRLLEWGCRNYQITLDGLAEEHDCKRVGRDGSPTYATILDNLRSMKARRDEFEILVRVNFDDANFPRLGPFLESLSEDFSGDHRFKLIFRAVGRWGGPNDEQLSTCGVDQQRGVLVQLRDKATELDLHQEGGIRDMNRFGAEVCYAARPYNFIVGATGKLMKCTVALYENEQNVVGQLLPDGTLELNDERMAKWVKPYFEADNTCKHCYVLPICQGALCPLSRINEGTRTCSSVKGLLKREMRLTMNESQATLPSAQPAVAEPIAELAGVA